jgi:putative ABC transport system permease protein
MAVVRRGVKNASRNLIRSVSVVAILALAISLAVVMLLSRQAVESRIEQVKGEVGTTVTVTPAGSRGFAGGGEPLTAGQIATMTSTPHVLDVMVTDNTATQQAAVQPVGGPGGCTGGFAAPDGAQRGAQGALQGGADGQPPAPGPRPAAGA